MAIQAVHPAAAAADVLDRAGDAVGPGVETVVLPLCPQLLVHAGVQMADDGLALSMAGEEMAAGVHGQVSAARAALGAGMLRVEQAAQRPRELLQRRPLAGADLGDVPVGGQVVFLRERVVMRWRDRERVTIRQPQTGGLVQAARLDAHVARAAVLDQRVEIFDARQHVYPAR